MNTFLVVTEIGGGVLLFLLGMQWLSSALREAAGDRLRSWLAAATGSPGRGFLLGSATGTLAQSSAATVMTVGFVHAGLLPLAGAIPVILGANVGTTLSMQLISLRPTDYALAAVGIGGVMHLAIGEGRWKTIGRAVLGMGLLFLGMKLSGEALVPYRSEVATVLSGIDGATTHGLVTGVVLAAVLTAVLQSSGAVIGMTFVLAQSGALGSLWQTYPIVLGAHVGTTITAVLASIGASPEARRAAFANTGFNLFNAALGVGTAPLLVPWLQGTSSDLVHQTANAHTAVMVLAALLMLPFRRAFAALLRRLVRSREPEPPGSHLDPRLLASPEHALAAVLRELGRCAALCRESFERVNRTCADGETRRLLRVRRNELSIDEIKRSVRAYVRRLAAGALSHRQAVLARALTRCVDELERVGDHVDNLGWIVRNNGARILANLDDRTAGEVFALAGCAERVVAKLVLALDPDRADFDEVSWEVLEARNQFNREVNPVRTGVNDRLARNEVPPELVLAFADFVVALERIVRHCAVIAREQREPDFAFERSGPGGPPPAVGSSG